MNGLYEPTQTTFCGVPMLQNWADLPQWEEVLNNFRFNTLVEFGTYKGGFGLFLQTQCLVRGIRFRTFDSQDHGVPELLRPNFWRMNIFTEHPETLFAHPLLLFCDNGNKPGEVEMFAPYLLAGDVLAVHDWGNEFKQEHLAPIEKRVIAVSAPERSITRFFAVVL